mmetsp:Transcript_71944/g.185576  ORF Transcript_71944/g.185576 Transcript_71944/m.185576 type:complete len:207 (-) Transcript_71944:366-986(-)
MIRPPTTVSPLIALVTDMSGECSAAVTPATTSEPTRHAMLSVVVSAVTLGLTWCSASKPQMPPVYVRAFLSAPRNATLLGSTGSTAFSVTVSAAAGGGGGGLYSGSGRRSPSRMTQQPRTASSASSRKKRPFGPMESRNLDTLLANSSEACAGADCTMSVPRMVTPLEVTSLVLGTVLTQLPPLAAARSTTTLPGRITSTISLRIR